MGVTITEIGRLLPFKGLRQLIVDVTMDSSYPTGGEAISASDLGVTYIHSGGVIGVEPDPTQSGIAARWDQTNKKVIAYNAKFSGQITPPRVVFEETVTSASNVGNLAYNAAHIWYIAKDGLTFKIVDKGTTPGTGEVAVDFTPATGTTKLTFASADSDPVVKVTYWPADSNKLLADNLVESDVVDATPASGHASIALEVITITDGAAAIICVDVDGTLFKPVYAGDTPATGEYVVVWDSSGDTTLTGSGTEFSAATSIKITFIKLISGLTYVDDASSHSTDVVTLAQEFYCPRLSVYTPTADAAEVPHLVTNASETLAANEVKVTEASWKGQGITGLKLTYHADTDVADSGFAYISMLDSELAQSVGEQNLETEVDSATDLSACKIRMTFFYS